MPVIQSPPRLGNGEPALVDSEGTTIGVGSRRRSYAKSRPIKEEVMTT
jgi:hypothetical protein